MLMQEKQEMKLTSFASFPKMSKMQRKKSKQEEMIKRLSILVSRATMIRVCNKWHDFHLYCISFSWHYIIITQDPVPKHVMHNGVFVVLLFLFFADLGDKFSAISKWGLLCYCERACFLIFTDNSLRINSAWKSPCRQAKHTSTCESKSVKEIHFRELEASLNTFIYITVYYSSNINSWVINPYLKDKDKLCGHLLALMVPTCT